MAIPPRPQLGSLRVKLALISFGTFLVTTACGWLRPCAEPTPVITCYTAVAPTASSTPAVMCYEVILPTITATPSPTMLMCYTPTPSPVCYDTATIPGPAPVTTPSATPQARQTLLETLLAEGRFPGAVADQLGQ
ncbi:MAG: hypothetical protein KKA73_05720 [Chloroflexi bacterium]|nr:hypothetical protein [Chloroflexota bacterium]